jgi:hypothetical protein
MCSNSFALYLCRYNKIVPGFVDWAQDPVNPRPENFGFGMSLVSSAGWQPACTLLSAIAYSDLTTSLKLGCRN